MEIMSGTTADAVLEEVSVYEDLLKRGYRPFGYANILYKESSRPEIFTASAVRAEEIFDPAQYSYEDIASFLSEFDRRFDAYCLNETANRPIAKYRVAIVMLPNSLGLGLARTSFNF